MSETLNQNLETAIPHVENQTEKMGFMETISANIEKVREIIRKGIHRIFEWSKNTAKQIIEWATPLPVEPKVHSSVKATIEKEPGQPAEKSVQAQVKATAEPKEEQAENPANQL